MTTPGFAFPSEQHDPISRRAAEFIERRRFGDWNEADQAEVDAWLAESPLHRVGYLRVEWSVARAGELAAMRPAAPVSGAPSSAPPASGVRLRPRYMIPLLAAASVALAVTWGAPLANYLMQAPIRTYSTDVGGRTLLKFKDGTEVELDTDTVARFRMTNKERTVWLDKGAAWFHVSHDAENPFSVIVGRHRVTDLGTEFLVRRGSDRMEVALVTGRATLSTEGAPIAMLRPGDDAVATPISMSIKRKTPQELSDKLAWRRGILVFRNTRLADAVREFNRYNDTKLVIADPSIEDVKFSAEVQTDHFDDFVRFAQTMLKLRVERQGNDILLSQNASDEPRKVAHIKRSERNQ